MVLPQLSFGYVSVCVNSHELGRFLDVGVQVLPSFSLIWALTPAVALAVDAQVILALTLCLVLPSFKRYTRLGR